MKVSGLSLVNSEIVGSGDLISGATSYFFYPRNVRFTIGTFGSLMDYLFRGRVRGIGWNS